MTPYASLLYFCMSLYFVLPLLAWCLLRGRHAVWPWIAVLSVGLLFVHYWDGLNFVGQRGVRETWVVLSYGLLQWLCARGFLALTRRTRSGWTFLAVLAAALVPLLYEKFSAPEDADALPLFAFAGISYITFRALDVVIGIRDGLITELPLRHYLSYLLFFATTSSGPIDRYRRFVKDFDRVRSRHEFLIDLDASVRHLFRGLFYKFVCAYLLYQYCITPLTTRHDGMGILWYAYAYTLYLFFDFAGYSAFAVGFSNLLGVRTPENFNRPFLARDIREFWDRWHISLSWWFRDHVYMRFVMKATKAKWFKSRFTASYLGFILTMGLMGIWHGTAWFYVLYGLYHAALLIGHDLWVRFGRKRWGISGLMGEVLAILLTFHFVAFGLLLFSGRLAHP